MLVLTLLSLLHVTTADVTALPTTSDQQRGFETINGRVYYFSAARGLHPEVMVACNDLDMELAAFETESEFLDVSNYIRDTLLTETIQYWTSGLRVGYAWMWTSTNRRFDYNVTWAPNEPTEEGATLQACVKLQNGQLSDESCGISANFICEQRDCSSCSQRNGFDLKDTVQINGRNYYFSTLTANTSGSMTSCGDIGMDPLGLETEEESIAIFAYVRDVLNTPKQFYHTSGLHVYQDWVWTATGKLFSYANWCPGCPNQTDSAQSCVVLNDGNLKDLACNDVDRFICEQKDCPACP
ncbi:hypothetical protein B566_EDAN009603 [Ephemera danica]|nr:hypothetical protein B566_EDAN009603 [Ephemera danica]